MKKLNINKDISKMSLEELKNFDDELYSNYNSLVSIQEDGLSNLTEQQEKAINLFQKWLKVEIVITTSKRKEVKELIKKINSWQ